MTASAALRFDEFYRTSAYAAFPQEHRGGGRLGVRLFVVEQTAHDFTDAPVTDIALVTALAGAPVYRRDIGDGWSRPAPFTGADVTLMPARTEGRFEVSADHTILCVAAPESRIAAMLDGYPGLSLSALDAVGARAAFRSAGVRETMLRMWRAAGDADPAAQLALDTLTHDLVARLLRIARAPDAPAREMRALDAAALSRVADLVEANLGEPLTVEMLAAAAGRSAYHFSRLFKAATGLSPHRFVVARRVARARALLSDARLPLAEIAYACGFASQSHMTDVFRRELGTPPGALRRGAPRA